MSRTVYFKKIYYKWFCPMVVSCVINYLYLNHSRSSYVNNYCVIKLFREI